MKKQITETAQTTPLEQLLNKKELLKRQAKIKEENVSANILYLQKNGAKLLLNSATSAILPSKTSKTKPSKASSLSSNLTDLAISGVSSYMNGGKGLIPLAWGFAQPIVLTWGIKKAKKMIGKLFKKKQK